MLEGDGRATVFAGGWTDMLAQRGTTRLTGTAPAAATRATAAPAEKARETGRRNGLSFTEKHRFDALPGIIDRLTAEISKLDDLLADPDLYSREPVKFRKATEALTERQNALATAEDEWLALAEKAEN
jgi:ATP-binding cassette subfamily F protein uup